MDLQITVGDTSVAGRFTHRSHSLIEVEITEPFVWFRAFLEMKTFARPDQADGFLGSQGIESGREVLRRLYQLCLHLSRNRDRLVAAYAEYQQGITDLGPHASAANGMFAGMKQALADRFKAGEMDEDRYYRELGEAIRLHSHYNEHLFLLQDDFFTRNFPFTVDTYLRPQVLEYVRRVRKG